MSLARVARSPALVVVLAFLTSIGVIAFGQAYHVQRSLNVNDDNLYLYTNGLRLIDPATADRLDEQVMAGYERTEASVNLTFRFVTRIEHAYNYFVETVGLAAGQRIFRPPADAGAAEYAGCLARALTFGFVMCGVFAALVTLVALGMTRSSLLMAAFALALVVTFLIDSSLVDKAYAGMTGGNEFPRAQATLLDPGESLVKLVFLQLVRPRHGFTALGFLTKAHLWLMLMAVFALRWRQRYALAYGTMFAMALVHQSMTGLLVGLFVMVDAIARPRMLAGRPVALLVLGLVALHLAREQLWRVIIPRDSWPLVLGGLALIGVAAAALAWRFRRRLPEARRRLVELALDRRPRIVDQSSTMGRVIVEMGILVAFWAVTFPMAMIINTLVGELQSVYFWSHLHGRMLSALRPGLILGGVYVALLWWRQRAGEERFALVPAAACVVALAVAVGLGVFELEQGRRPIERMAATAEGLAAELTPIETLEGADEPRVYYAISRTMQTDVDAVSMLFPGDVGE